MAKKSDPIWRFAEHVLSHDYRDLPVAAVEAAKTFILDSLGVGLIGSTGPWMEELLQCQDQWGEGDDARVWCHGPRLPAPAAAMCNAYQIHNCEFDCVHEDAVVHPVTVVLPSVLAVAERMGGINGRGLISAVTLGVDVACHLGVAATSGLRFFRPGTAGAFAAVSGIGKICGFDAATLVNAYSIAYGQLCGTMQPHTEGSMLLAMQIAFNARNAVMACDMAAAGLRGPENILTGEFGYFNLIELENNLNGVLADLGQIWRITEVAHKPYPSGRATHGVVDALAQLITKHDLNADTVDAIEIGLPPLTHQLTGRPVHGNMNVNYARLCIPYVAARLLLNSALAVSDFLPEALQSQESLELASRIHCWVVENPDANALTPVIVAVLLRNGRRLESTVDVVYGNPAKPMSRADQLRKFHGNAAAAARPIMPEQAEAIVRQIETLEGVDDLAQLVDNLIA